MSEIKAGDLVMVVRLYPCCGGGRLGDIFRAGQVGPSGATILCPHCNTALPPAMITETEEDTVCHLHRLKRIDPLTEPESIEHREEQPA